MPQRIYTATITITKPDDCCTFHQPWVYEYYVEQAVKSISGHEVKVAIVEKVGFFQRWMKAIADIDWGTWAG